MTFALIYKFNPYPTIPQKAPYGKRQVDTQVHVEKQTCIEYSEKNTGGGGLQGGLSPTGEKNMVR